MLLRSGGVGARSRQRKLSRTGTAHITGNKNFFTQGQRETHTHARRGTGVGVREKRSIGVSMGTRLSMTCVSAKHYGDTCTMYAAAPMLLRCGGMRCHGRQRPFFGTRTADIGRKTQLLSPTHQTKCVLARVLFHRNMPRLPLHHSCLLYTSPSPRDGLLSRMPSSA